MATGTTGGRLATTGVSTGALDRRLRAGGCDGDGRGQRARRPRPRSRPAAWCGSLGARRAPPAGADAGARQGALGRLLAVGDLVAVVDPDLHADHAERGLGLGRAVVDLRAERVQRDAALAVPLATRHLGATQPSAGLHADAQGAGAHGGLHGAAHGAAEGDAADELLGHALRQQRGVGLGPRLAGGRVHVLDLHVDALLREALDVLAQAVDLRALAPDHDAGAGRADEHPDLVALALDVDAGDAGALQQRPRMCLRIHTSSWSWSA